MRSANAGKKIAFGVIAIAGIIALSELMLNLLAFVSPAVKRTLAREEVTVSRLIPDQRLKSRPDPAFPEHDPRTGFRNRYYPAKANVVAFGDSQTYGLGVKREDAWPQQLAKMANLEVYQYAFGGYGPVHSLLLLDEAMALKPELVIEAFYSGNDLHDAYSLVYDRGSAPGLKSKDEKTLADIARVNASEPYREKIDRQRRGLHQESVEEGPHGRWREFVADHSKLYGVFRTVKRLYLRKRFVHDWNFNWDWIKRDLKNAGERAFLFEKGDIKAAFLPPYRLSALDFRDPRVREGLRISLAAMEEMNERISEQGAKFAVLFLPTKELVYKDAVLAKGDPLPEAYVDLIRNEEQVWTETKAFLDASGIAYIDALPVLKDSLSRGEPPFWMGLDSHQNETGCRVVAALVFDWMMRGQLLVRPL